MGDISGDPPLAIDGGADGLDLARACASVAACHVLSGGPVRVQFGTAEQAATLARCLPDRLADGKVRAFERGVVLRLVQGSGS